MDNIGTINNARLAFERFVESFDSANGSRTPPRDELEYLQEYLAVWLEDGDGVEVTGGSYETYCRTIIDIADVALRGELCLDYKGTPEAAWKNGYSRTISGIHEPGLSGAAFMERAQYELVRYRRQQGMTGPSI